VEIVGAITLNQQGPIFLVSGLYSGTEPRISEFGHYRAPKIIFRFSLTFMKEHYFLATLRDCLSYTACRIWLYFTFTGVKEGVKLAMHISINFPCEGQY